MGVATKKASSGSTNPLLIITIVVTIALASLHAWVKLGLFGAAVILLYALSCGIWPLRTCPSCNGDPRHKEKWGIWPGAFRAGCRRCKGTGRVLRLGARAWGRWRDSTRSK